MRAAIVIPIILAIVLALLGMAQPQIESKPKAMQKLQSPTRLAANAAGHLFVSSYDQMAVVRVDPAQLNIMSKIPISGNVTGLAAWGGRVYVGNETLRRIEVYDESGPYLGLLGGSGTVISDPSDLAVDAGRALLFAVDGSAKTIKVFSLNGAGVLVGTISGPGLGVHLLQHPTGLAVDPGAQEVFVSDYGDVENGVPPRVAVFGYDGGYHGSVSGSNGTQGYFFSKPQGVAVGASGHVFVVDAWLGRVLVMDRSTGLQVSTLGVYGSASGQLKLPLDVLILGPSSDLYVTSNLTHKVEVFPKGGQR